MAKVYETMIRVIDLLYDGFFGAAMWLEKKRGVVWAKWDEARRAAA